MISVILSGNMSRITDKLLNVKFFFGNRDKSIRDQILLKIIKLAIRKRYRCCFLQIMVLDIET